MIPDNSHSWFVVWTGSRAEKKVEARLTALGVTTWLPVFSERRRWSDRWKDVISPLFPGYLFARAGSIPWPTVVGTPGVLTIVKNEGTPALLSDHFVSGLRSFLERPDETRAEAVNDFPPGEEVVIQHGALKGVRGVIREIRNRTQIVIWVAEIGKGVAFTIGTELIALA